MRPFLSRNESSITSLSSASDRGLGFEPQCNKMLHPKFDLCQTLCYFFGPFPQRDLAAILAISDLFFGESLSALALPPLRPPNRPRATAAGFFSDWSDFFFLVGSSAGAPVTACRISNAVTLTSADGFFFFIPLAYMSG